MKNRNAETAAQALIIAMFVLAIWTWPSAPARIPIHWNFQGQIDGYGSKVVGLFWLPLLALAGYALIGLAPRIKPERFNGQLRRALSWFTLTYVMVTAGVFGVIVVDVRGANINMNYVIYPLLAFFWIAIGNLLVRSGQAKVARTTPPGGGVQV